MKVSSLLARSCSVFVSGLLLTVVAHAQPVNLDDKNPAAQLKERAAAREQARVEIRKIRAEIESRKIEAEKDCWQKFAVENCLSKVRKAAREEDNVLRERELRINSEERHDKADERLRAIEQKKREKQVPSPVTVTPRDGSGVLSTESRATEAQKRAAEQAKRVKEHEASVAAKQTRQAKERAEAVQAQKEKIEAAEARRASKAAESEHRKAAPLPIPDIPPKP